MVIIIMTIVTYIRADISIVNGDEPHDLVEREKLWVRRRQRFPRGSRTERLGALEIEYRLCPYGAMGHWRKPKPKSYAASCTPCGRQRATGQIRGDLELVLGPWMDLRGIPEALQQPAIKCPVQRNGNLFDAI